MNLNLVTLEEFRKTGGNVDHYLLTTAKELIIKLKTDGILRQNDPVMTVVQFLEAVLADGMIFMQQECIDIVEQPIKRFDEKGMSVVTIVEDRIRLAEKIKNWGPVAKEK